MAIRPPLCHEVDVFRLFDPTITEADLSTDGYIGNEDVELVRGAIDDTCSEFELRSGHVLRLTRVGAPNSPETYEYRGIEGDHRRPPIRVNLDFRDVLPFDSTQNDTVEYRSGRDDWTPITDDEGDEFTLNYTDGTLKLYRWLISQIAWDVHDERYLRLTYRCGGLGGSQFRGGQTTLDGDVASDDTSVSVSDAARLPNAGVCQIVGSNREYVRITNVNYSTNTLTVTRGVRATTTSSHSDGDTIHFCPEGARKAIAGRVAKEIQEHEPYVDALVNTEQGIQPDSRIESWSESYDRLCAKYSRVHKL